MTLCLAVDTTADYGSIALAGDDGVIEEVALHAPRGFSHVLFSEIEALLARQHRKFDDVTLFAGASGPGSFTGVRVGLAAIKGLAHVTGRPVVALSNLAVLASYGAAAFRAPVIDAKRGEVYAAVYNAEGEIVVPETVGKLESFIETARVHDPEWITATPELLPFASVYAPQAIAGQLAKLAIERGRAGKTALAAAIEANYVRRSDAEILFRDNSVS